MQIIWRCSQGCQHVWAYLQLAPSLIGSAITCQRLGSKPSFTRFMSCQLTWASGNIALIPAGFPPFLWESVFSSGESMKSTTMLFFRSISDSLNNGTQIQLLKGDPAVLYAGQ